MLTPAAAVAAAFPILLIWAAAADIVSRSIPNSAVILLAACYLVFAGSAGIGMGQIVSHLACSCAVLAGGFALYSQDLFGGGDAKLLACAALWTGFDRILQLLAGVALAGGGLSLIYLCASCLGAGSSAGHARPGTVPYGAAIAAGTLAAIPDCLTAF